MKLHRATYDFRPAQGYTAAIEEARQLRAAYPFARVFLHEVRFNHWAVAVAMPHPLATEPTLERLFPAEVA